MNRIQRAWHALTGPQTASKSPAPISADKWMLSVLNGDYGRDEQVDIMSTATAARCVNRIASDLASVPIVIEERRPNGDWVKVEPAARGQKSPKYGDVAGVFERANPREGKTALWMRFHQSMELDGAAVLFTDYLNNGGPPRGAAPKELRFLRPDQLKAVWPRDRGLFSDPLAYSLGKGGRELRPDEVLWHVYPDSRSDDPLCGLSPSSSAAPYAHLESAQVDFTTDFYENGARGSLALETDETPSEAQRGKIEDDLTRKHIGRGKRFKVFLLTHGLKAKELTGRRDSDMADVFVMVRQQQAMNYGVPLPLLSDFSDGVKANVDECTPIYIEGTLMNKGPLLEQNLTEIALLRWDSGGNLRARLNWDAMPMVQRMKRSIIVSMSAAVGGPCVLPDEAREWVGLPRVTGGQLMYPAPGQALGIGPVPAPKPVRTAKAHKWIDDPLRHAKRIAAGISLDRFEGVAEKMLRAYFTQAEIRALHAFGAGEKQARNVRTKDIFDEEEEVELASGLIARIYANVATTRGPEAMGEVGGDPGSFLIDDPEVQAFLVDSAYGKGKLIVGTTRDLLRQAITTANSEGMTVAETANLIRDVFALRRSQALTIARTETTSAYNTTTFLAHKQSGLVDRIQWLSAHDSLVRDTHADYDGDEVEFGQEFAPGLKYPGDPDCTDASQVCNCRCVYVTVETPVKRLVVRPGTFDKLFRNGTLTPSPLPTDKAAV